MSHRAFCTCEFCEQDRALRSHRMHVARPEPGESADLLAAWACTLFLLLAVLGVFASWWVSSQPAP